MSQRNFPELTLHIRKRNPDHTAPTGGVKLNVCGFFGFVFWCVFFFFLREMEGKNKKTQNRTLLEKRMKINQQ